MDHTTSDLFTAGNAKVEEGLSSASYQIAKSVLTNLTTKCAIDKVSNLNIGCRTQ